MPISDNALVIHTDGACHGNPGPGGYGAFWGYDGERWELFGGSAHTTNNQMELGAIIAGLKALHQAIEQNLVARPSSIVVRSDSQYAIKGATQWRHAWKKKGWKGSDGKTIKNLDLWQSLDGLLESMGPRWSMEWVRGHNGDPHNEHADLLAQEGVHLIKSSTSPSVSLRRRVQGPLPRPNARLAR